MPRLQAEPYLLPADLFERPRSDAAPIPLWWAMYTKPRAEKAFVRRFQEVGGEFFLPQFTRRSLYRGRVKTSHLPLFPGYVFIYGQDENRLSALKTNLIVQTLEVLDQHQLHNDLAAVHRLMRAGHGLSPEDQLEPGSLVEITYGALRGMVGRVIRRENRLKFLVEVRLLQRGVSMEIESWMIEKQDTSDSEIALNKRTKSGTTS
jgi:transcriptional antiterminator NusG